MKTQVNSLKICSFPKIQSLKSFGNSWLIRSVSGDNFVFNFSTISWLWLQQETMWVNINFERRDLTSAQKRHSSPDDFGETYFIIKSITRSLIIFRKPRKMTNDFFNHYIFARMFQWTSSECLTNVTITVKVAMATCIYFVKMVN